MGPSFQQSILIFVLILQRQRHALRVVRMEHLLRGLCPEGGKLPGDEETSETEVRESIAYTIMIYEGKIT